MQGIDHHRPIGVRSGAQWRRRGEAPRELQTRTPARLLRDHELTHRHTASRAWTDADADIEAELGARCLGVIELSALAYVAVPRWLEAHCRLERHHRAGWARLLGVLAYAYALGALGVRVTYDQLAAELGVSRSTAARWIREMLAAELIVRVHTYAPADDIAPTRERVRAANVYRIGPALDDLALLEGVIGQLDPRLRGAVRRAARARRAAARDVRRDAACRARAAQRGPALEDAEQPSAELEALEALEALGELEDAEQPSAELEALEAEAPLEAELEDALELEALAELEDAGELAGALADAPDPGDALPIARDAGPGPGRAADTVRLSQCHVEPTIRPGSRGPSFARSRSPGRSGDAGAPTDPQIGMAPAQQSPPGTAPAPRAIGRASPGSGASARAPASSPASSSSARASSSSASSSSASSARASSPLAEARPPGIPPSSSSASSSSPGAPSLGEVLAGIVDLAELERLTASDCDAEARRSAEHAARAAAAAEASLAAARELAAQRRRGTRRSSPRSRASR